MIQGTDMKPCPLTAEHYLFHNRNPNPAYMDDDYGHDYDYEVGVAGRSEVQPR